MKKAILLSLSLVGVLTAANGDAYTWPSYRADLDYDTKTNLGTIKAPTKFSDDCSGVTGKRAGEWWAFYWGNDRDPRVTDETIDSLLKKYDTDFAYLRDSMGWAPDRRAQDGYYSAVYYYGSGTCAGGAKTDTTGGWQTNVGSNWYEAVAASFYPVYSFNPQCPYRDRVAQMEAMVHEGIHSMTKAYPGAQNAHWFQEGGNTWIQQEMSAQRNPNEKQHSGMGFLNAGAVIAPFIPIESYSGWLLDGSFGGPNADGVEVRNGSTQLCNWRNLLGGYQYGNMFPTFLGEWVGKGAVRWIYGNAYGKTNYLLETFATNNGLGAENTRRLIMEYRARLALLDMKKWSENLRTLLNGNFGSKAAAEWEPAASNPEAWTMTPYAKTTDSSGVLIPENRTTPGWSGANIIPLTVQNGATQVSATLYPIGENMTLQIAYRATDGTPIYSEPVYGEGTAVLNLQKAAQSNVVFAIICNTDYQYTGNADIRKKHFDYRLKPELGISGAANINTKWYNDFNLDYEWPNLGENPSSSSSETPVISSSSNEPESSSSSTKNEVVEYVNAEVTLPIDDNYTGVSLDLNAQKIAEILGINNIANATYFALNGNTEDENSTAHAPGHWFNKNGAPVSYSSDEATIYSELNLSSTTALIGHYPNRVANGEIYTLKQGLKYGDKKIIWTITVKITNEIEISDGINLNYASPTKSHLSLNQRKGIIDVHYTLPRNDHVKINLYTGYGALIHQEISGLQQAGAYTKSLDINALNLPMGTYIVKVTTGAYREAKSITVAK